MPEPRVVRFVAEDLAGDATENALLLPYYGNDLQIEVAGYLSRLIGLMTEAITAGTIDVRKKLNGTQVAVELLEFTTTLDRYVEATFAATAHPLAVGDRLAFDVITAGMTPTTNDIIIIAEIIPT